MSHDAMGVTVSSNVSHIKSFIYIHIPSLRLLSLRLTGQEAKRLDSLTRDSLLANRKLSLIVDLDQTIIHTTVDPTVGDWMAEIEEDERSVGSSSEVGEAGTTTTPPGSPVRPTKRKREANPNATALRDVARFTLEDDPPAPGQGRRVKQPERWYYTKPR
jgi:RNA polymerase II subunit A-like phosphatase